MQLQKMADKLISVIMYLFGEDSIIFSTTCFDCSLCAFNSNRFFLSKRFHKFHLLQMKGEPPISVVT